MICPQPAKAGFFWAASFKRMHEFEIYGRYCLPGRWPTGLFPQVSQPPSRNGTHRRIRRTRHCPKPD
ncbi:hypothetical protein ACFONI_06670 [Aeromonas media]|uniref:hypothetical protein n=1 Tax=Aeromonas media TaxID=651 RepID=UPI00361688CE